MRGGTRLANIMDYLDWRGDLTMTASPFNEVDNLILSQLSYVNFEGIVPGMDSEVSISVKDASNLFFKKNSEKEIMSDLLVRISASLMKKMAQSQRFSNSRLSKYINRIDYEKQIQFSAINIILEDGTVYVAYRGTDDTIVGWKEDFNMSFMTTIPAQIEAVQYLTETAGSTNNKIRLGGHSKGGNLAVYSAVKCCPSIKENIIEVYNNDGPGFDKEMIFSREYKEMRNRIRTIVPQSSIVGMLLEHEEECMVVASKQKHIMQHYSIAWEVQGSQFVYVEGVTEESRRMEALLKTWINKMDVSERERFVDSLFYIFAQTEIKSSRDITKNKWRKIAAMRKIFKSMPSENRKALMKTVRLLITEGSKVFRAKSKQEELNGGLKVVFKKVVKNKNQQEDNKKFVN